MDFGKRIKRVVQKADQNFGRAEKSEVLTDEIQAMEKLIELIKQSFQGTLKKFHACLPPTADPEKRLRKLPESALSMSLIESASQLNQSPVFSKAFSRFGEAEQNLADALLHFTVEVENSFLQPLVTVVDREIPAIQKLRKQLTNMALDMDSAKKALSALQKQTQVPPGKIDSAREDLEAEEVKVDQCRDQLLTEIYQFFSREEKLCKMLLSALQLQADYHRRALSSLEKQISQMRDEIEQNSAKPVYGLDLREHLLFTKQKIATVIEVCVQSIERLGLDAEGLFRLAPSASKLRKLTAAFDANIVDDDLEDVDIHCLAGALKLYLRELPNPLLTFELYDDWSNASQREGSDRISALLATVNKLPKENYNNLRYLIRFLSNIAKYSDMNKMSTTNLAIVVAPNLLYPSKAEQGGMLASGVAMSVVEPLISHCELFFPANNSAASPIDPGKAPATAEANSKFSPNQRNKKVSGGDKPKKQTAPVPPLGRLRSESIPNYSNNLSTSDITPENSNAVLNSEVKPKDVDKRSSPQMKTALGSGYEGNSGSKENLDDTENTRVILGGNEEQLKERHKKLVRSKALGGGNQFDEENKQSDDEACNNYEVFTPPDNRSPESQLKAQSPRLALERKDSRSGNAQKNERSSPSSAFATDGNSSVHGVAPSVAAVKAVIPQKQIKKDAADKPSVTQHTRNKSSPAEVMTSSMSAAAFVNFNKTGNLNIKSATLPHDKVSLCQARFRSQDGSDEDTSRPWTTETAEARNKPRPKVPPRSPARDKNNLVFNDLSKNALLEDTHL